MDFDDMSGIGIAVAIMVLLLWAIVSTVHEQGECERRGGHMRWFYKDLECLTADGRIIEL